MSKSLKNKDETLTMRVRKSTKDRARVLFEKTETAATFASFLGDLVLLGIQVEELISSKRGDAVEEIAEDKLLFTKDPEPAYMPEIKVHRPPEFDSEGAPISPDVVFIPCYGETAAGKPITFDTVSYGAVPWDKAVIKGDVSRYFVVRVRGTSMTEANIMDGAFVLARRAEAPRQNRIMLIRHGNESTLKRIKMKGDQEVYMCWEDGSGQVVRLDDQDYEIQGEYVEVMRG